MAARSLLNGLGARITGRLSSLATGVLLNWLAVAGWRLLRARTGWSGLKARVKGLSDSHLNAWAWVLLHGLTVTCGLGAGITGRLLDLRTGTVLELDDFDRNAWARGGWCSLNPLYLSVECCGVPEDSTETAVGPEDSRPDASHEEEHSGPSNRNY